MNTSQVIITPENMTKDRKISICVFLSGFSCFAQLYYFQPLLPDLAQEFGLSASYSSLAISFSTLGMVVGLFTAMFVADSIPRKKLISSGAIIVGRLFGDLVLFTLLLLVGRIKRPERILAIGSHFRVTGLYIRRSSTPE